MAARTGELLPLWDFLAVLLSGLLSRLAPEGGQSLSSLPVVAGSTMPLLWIAALVIPFLLYSSGFYEHARRGRLDALLSGYLWRMLAALLVLATLAYAGHWFQQLPRSRLALWLFGTVALTTSMRLLLVLQLQRLQQRGALSETLAVIGAGARTTRLIERLGSSIRLYGVFDDHPPRNRGSKRPQVCDGDIDTLIARAMLTKPDRLLIVLPATDAQALSALLERLRPLGIAIDLCPRHLDARLPAEIRGNDPLSRSASLPLRLLSDRPIRQWDAISKRSFDLVVGSLITLMLMPLLAMIALSIRLDSPGPVLFLQRRHGFNNSEFDIRKFRTMYDAGDGSQSPLQQTVRNDPRITRVGRFLRKWSLDELPQLLNVLRGEMSLVGPRPHALDMRTEERLGHDISDAYAHRHRVRPGITGWAQVNGARGATHTAQQLNRRIELDLYYIERWSLLLDLRILLRTFREVLRATNAY
jgi:Undecaprenyl-phosphate glucose phosphotransferase